LVCRTSHLKDQGVCWSTYLQSFLFYVFPLFYVPLLYIFFKKKTQKEYQNKKDQIIIGGSCLIAISSFPSFLFCLDVNKSLWYLSLLHLSLPPSMVLESLSADDNMCIIYYLSCFSLQWGKTLLLWACNLLRILACF
jgi:hypothetical protein